MPKRIAILGGPRCGKTTLIQQLYVEMKIRDLNVGVATEYSTDYLRAKNSDSVLFAKDRICLSSRTALTEVSSICRNTYDKRQDCQLRS